MKNYSTYLNNFFIYTCTSTSCDLMDCSLACHTVYIQLTMALWQIRVIKFTTLHHPAVRRAAQYPLDYGKQTHTLALTAVREKLLLMTAVLSSSLLSVCLSLSLPLCLSLFLSVSLFTALAVLRDQLSDSSADCCDHWPRKIICSIPLLMAILIPFLTICMVNVTYWNSMCMSH